MLNKIPELYDRWRSRRRRYYMTPNVGTLSLGVTVLGITVVFLLWDAKTEKDRARRDAGLLVSGVLGTAITVMGLKLTPAHDHEQDWRDRWNELRVKTGPFGAALDAAYVGWRHDQTVVTIYNDKPTTYENDWPLNWRELAHYARWPDVDKGLPGRWEPILTRDGPQPTRRLFAFLRAIEQLPEIAAFRPYGTTAYEWFGLRIETPGLEPFLLAEGVKREHRDILLALAYLNLAVGIRQGWKGAADMPEGFWRLGARWYPPLLRPPWKGLA